MKIGECKFCLEQKELIEAHIIPKAFYAHIISLDNFHPRLYSSEPNSRHRRSPIGVYDCEILCRGCEDKFSKWDNYAIELLINKYNANNITVLKGENVYQVKNYEYPKLKLFFLSVLWRGHVSKQPFFKKISLGSHEQIIRKMLLKNNSGSTDCYPMMLAKYDDSLGSNIIVSPERGKHNKKINYYEIQLASYCVLIKVDKRKILKSMEDICIQPNVLNIWLLNSTGTQRFNRLANFFQGK